jgi:predicted TIM-barrel fold metal-dependent hydrolase
MVSRRRVTTALSLAALAPLVPQFAWGLVKTVPYEAPNFPVPKGACDSHVHVFDSSRFPFAPDRVYTPDEAPLSELEKHQRRLHMQRVVLVQPSPYGTDNRCMLDALGRLGPKVARGIAVVGPDATTQSLKQLYASGVRGLRANIETYGNADASKLASAVQTLTQQAGAAGLHVQMYASLKVITALTQTLLASPVPVVLDHFAKIQASAGLEQPGWSDLLKLLESGRIYIKLSALYRVSTAPGYADVAPFVRKLAEVRPDRLIWASDWPHTMPAPGEVRKRDAIEYFRVEDDGRALNLVMGWLKSPKLIHQVLVDNPTRLFWT